MKNATNLFAENKFSDLKTFLIPKFVLDMIK